MQFVFNGTIGEIKDIYSYQSQNKTLSFFCDIVICLYVYLILELIPFIIWICIFQFKHIWRLKKFRKIKLR